MNPENINVCIYHANCMDGFAAAWAVWKRFPHAKFIAATYGDTMPTVEDIADKNVVIVDFSYSHEILENMRKAARTVIVLDHHLTAKDNLKYVRSAARSWDEESFGLRATFDMEKSGALMAWEYFHPARIMPNFILHVQDRDLWKFELEHTKAIHLYASSYEFSFENMNFLVNTIQFPSSKEQAIQSGYAIQRAHDKNVKEIVEATRRFMLIDGKSVPAANVPFFMASDAGHLLAADAPFSATYCDTATHRVFSLRSREDGDDVSKIAKIFGGGGHKHAAGFRLPFGWEGDPT